MEVMFIGELRGMKKQTSKKGNDYLVLNIEDKSGESNSIVSKDLSISALGLKKGNIVKCYADLIIGKFTTFNINNVEKIADTYEDFIAED